MVLIAVLQAEQSPVTRGALAPGPGREQGEEEQDHLSAHRCLAFLLPVSEQQQPFCEPSRLQEICTSTAMKRSSRSASTGHRLEGSRKTLCMALATCRRDPGTALAADMSPRHSLLLPAAALPRACPPPSRQEAAGREQGRRGQQGRGRLPACAPRGRAARAALPGCGPRPLGQAPRGGPALGAGGEGRRGWRGRAAPGGTEQGLLRHSRPVTCGRSCLPRHCAAGCSRD